jgi:large subunit ribosomal protein L33
MREIVKLVSTAGTGCNSSTTKNKQKTPDQLQFKGYDPKVRRHVLFVEGGKVRSGKKK